MILVNYWQSHGKEIVMATMHHMELFSESMLVSLLLGLVLGIGIHAFPRSRVATSVLHLTAAFQAIPSIAVVAVAFLFLGIGAVPALVALVLYSLAPVVFNTVSGLQSIPERVRIAARGIGMSWIQRLARVELPMAWPVVMGGVRSAATINIGTATVAAIIGGGGLGDLIYSGLKLRNNDAILTGALLAAVLAILVDAILALVERLLTSPGLRGLSQK